MSEIELTTKQRNKIKRACKALDDVLKEVQSENPDFNILWYLEDSSNWHLMEDESHSGLSGEPRHDRVIDTFWIDAASGGGW